MQHNDCGASGVIQQLAHQHLETAPSVRCYLAAVLPVIHGEFHKHKICTGRSEGTPHQSQTLPDTQHEHFPVHAKTESFLELRQPMMTTAA